MPFAKNDPKTIEAAKRGGTTGKKNFQTMPKEKLRKVSSKAGRISGEKRRALREKQDKAAKRYGKKIMDGYLEQ